MSTAQALALAAQRVDVARLPPQPENYSIGDALRGLASAETKLQAAVRRLAYLEQNRLVTQADYTAFNLCAASLWQAQTVYYWLLSRTIEDFPDMITGPVMERIPRPQLVTLRPGMAVSYAASMPQAGVSGLGALPAVVWAGIVLAVLAGMAIAAWLITSFAEDIARVFVVQRQVDAYEEMLDRRGEIMRACLERGGSQEACVREAQRLVPEPPDLRPKGSGTTKLAFALGAVVVIAGGFALYWGWDTVRDKMGMSGVGAHPRASMRGRASRTVRRAPVVVADLKQRKAQRKRKKKAKKRGVAGMPRRVAGVHSREPSTYFLEVD